MCKLEIVPLIQDIPRICHAWESLALATVRQTSPKNELVLAIRPLSPLLRHDERSSSSSSNARILPGWSPAGSPRDPVKEDPMDMHTS